jgi:hypothetical protein
MAPGLKIILFLGPDRKIYPSVEDYMETHYPGHDYVEDPWTPKNWAPVVIHITDAEMDPIQLTYWTSGEK